MSVYPLLESPIKIGSRHSRNRIAFSPTGRGYCDPNGAPNDQTICSYLAIAQGGVGWVIVEHTLVTRKYGPQWPNMLALDDDEQMIRWNQLALALRSLGVLTTVQLSPGLGRLAHPRASLELVAPSSVPYEIPPGSAPPQLRSTEGKRGAVPRELSTSEIEELEWLFVQAARRASKCGFDGIEIHLANGYLGYQFLSPLANRRSDRYGGDESRRLTLAVNLIRKTREALGPRPIVGIRLSAAEHLEGGYTLEDAKAFVPKLVDAGLDYVNVSSGSSSAMQWNMPRQEGKLVEESAAIKKVCSVPVICPNVHSATLGEDVLRLGKADVVSSSRGLIADPEWPLKALEGRDDEINRCVFCYQCLPTPIAQCPVNPRAGWERFFPEYWPRRDKSRPRHGGRAPLSQYGTQEDDKVQ